jgi:hypothetical protein
VFQVPQGYFEQLEHKLKAIPQEQETKVIHLKAQTFRRRLLAVAAVFIVVITATWQFLPKQEEESLTADDLIALTNSGYLPYSEMAFLEVVDAETLDTISFEASSMGDYYEETQPELIEEYYLLIDEI